MGTVHQLPVAHKPERSIESELADVLRRAVHARVGADGTFGQREEAALALANEATRTMLGGDLQAMADTYDEVLLIDGRVFKQHEPGTAEYHCLSGPLLVSRWTYREVGVRNGPTAVPLDLEAGLIERATPALAYRVTLGYAKGPMRSVEEDMKADVRCPPSRSTLERMAKAIGTKAKLSASRVERIVRRAERVPAEAVSTSLGLDRTSVPMEEVLAKGEPPAGRRKERRRPYLRQPPPRVNVKYRMAYVGTITFHDADGEGLVTRRYAAAAHESPEDLADRLVADLRGAVRRRPDLVVGIVQDGAPEMWNVLAGAVSREPVVTHWYEVIDRYHINERLAGMLRAVESDATLRQQQLSKWNDALDTTDGAVDDIQSWLNCEFTRAVATDDNKLAEVLQEHMTFFENNAGRVRYAALVARRLPIGSGATEGSCKSVIGMRTKRSGQRWHPDGLEAVLTVRATWLSDRLPQFWSYFAREYRAEIRKCA